MLPCKWKSEYIFNDFFIPASLVPKSYLLKVLIKRLKNYGYYLFNFLRYTPVNGRFKPFFTAIKFLSLFLYKSLPSAYISLFLTELSFRIKNATPRMPLYNLLMCEYLNSLNSVYEAQTQDNWSDDSCTREEYINSKMQYADRLCLDLMLLNHDWTQYMEGIVSKDVALKAISDTINNGGTYYDYVENLDAPEIEKNALLRHTKMHMKNIKEKTLITLKELVSMHLKKLKKPEIINITDHRIAL